MQYNHYVGHENQIYGVEEMRLVEGKGDNLRLFHVRNGEGLECMISPDRCTDIYRITYKGYNMSYFAPCSWVTPQYYNGENNDSWLPCFTSGFLTTCGLNNVGVPCEDDGVLLPQHGTISATPAEHAWWHIDEKDIIIEADMRDAKLFGAKLLMHREIRISKETSKIKITDTVENHGDTITPVMIMYHMNMGYPLLSENAIVDIPSDTVIPRDARAAENTDTCLKMLKPTAGFAEQCYFHTFKKEGKAKIFNPDIGVGLSISFDPNNLYCFTQWKMMGVHDYVLGLEPGNCTPMGRNAMRDEGKLQYIEPGETVKFEVCVDFYHNIDAWKNA